MGYTDEFQAVVWTSPSGTAFTLKTLESGFSQKHVGEVKENPRTSYSASTSSKGGKGGSKSSVSTSGGKKRVSDVNDTFTDLGIGGRDVALDCYFVGENHYNKAENFVKSLCEVGKSTLQLSYGEPFTVNVLNFKVTNQLLQNINCTVVNVSWHETAKTTYPASEKSKEKEIKNEAAAAKENLASGVADTVENITSPSRLQAFNANFTKALNKVSGALDFANNLTLKGIMNDILGQNIATSAFTMTSQLGIVLYKAASLTKKIANIGNGFVLTGEFGSLYNGWGSLISTLINNSATASSKTSLTKNEIDNLLINDTTASMALISLAETLIETSFETRAEAVEAAKNLVNLEQTWTSFVETESGKITDLGNYYIKDDNLQSVIAAAANEILERSYRLKIERLVVLSEDKTIIDLAYEYYKEEFYADPDATIEYLITTNNLRDDEFLILPRGSEVKIYV